MSLLDVLDSAVNFTSAPMFLKQVLLLYSQVDFICWTYPSLKAKLVLQPT